MGNSAAILIGSVIIAAAILFSLRWEVALAPNVTVRLDRWTGAVTYCTPKAMPQSVQPIPFDCEAK